MVASRPATGTHSKDSVSSPAIRSDEPLLTYCNYTRTENISLENCLSPHNPSAFELHAGRFRASMHQATSSLAASPLSPPAPALLNAMYLVGCFFSDDPSLWAAQSHYLTSTRKSLSDSLGDPKVSLVQWLQASCLLSYYLFRNSRLLEARQEVSEESLDVDRAHVFPNDSLRAR